MIEGRYHGRGTLGYMLRRPWVSRFPDTRHDFPDLVDTCFVRWLRNVSVSIFVRWIFRIPLFCDIYRRPFVHFRHFLNLSLLAILLISSPFLLQLLSRFTRYVLSFSLPLFLKKFCLIIAIVLGVASITASYTVSATPLAFR
jgi:hypothetical protein